jgi:hypothetical protein
LFHTLTSQPTVEDLSSGSQWTKPMSMSSSNLSAFQLGLSVETNKSTVVCHSVLDPTALS